MTGERKILIVGAGLGGLTAALCLLRRGHEVEIYEQAPELGEIGAGVQLSANASRVFVALGLDDELRAVAVQPEAYRICLYRSGDTLNEFPLASYHESTFGAPYYHLHRADFHSILAARVEATCPGAVRLGAPARGFRHDGATITLDLADGSSASGDALIGADGIRSTIREQIVGRVPATFSGNIAWRATVPAERLPAGFMRRVITVWCGPGKHMVVYYIRRGELVNFVGCVETDAWSEESWTVKASWKELKADFAGWHEDIQTMIDAVDRNEVYRWAINHRPPVPQWSEGRATLLGDAAHPTSPFMAQGACMAVEDAAVIGRALDETRDVPDAFRLYERNRTERTARVVLGSVDHGKLYHLESEDALREAFVGRDIGRDRAGWLFSYDPLTVPLA